VNKEDYEARLKEINYIVNVLRDDVIKSRYPSIDLTEKSESIDFMKKVMTAAVLRDLTDYVKMGLFNDNAKR
jgi:hypothetical protein